MNNAMSPDQFISLLYRQAAQIPLADFSHWALDLLQQVISFEGAIWGTGHISTQKFHTQTTLDVSPDIFEQLKKHLAINPIFEQLLANSGDAVDMADVLNDQRFYNSDLYHQCFKPFGIERILSSFHLDERSGIFTLLTLYRYNRESPFSMEEKTVQNRLLYHLLAAASHRQFIELNGSTLTEYEKHDSAICDAQGIYHCVGTQFLNILDTHSSELPSQVFPLEIIPGNNEFALGNLLFSQQKMGDLYKISVRVKTQIDLLTQREKQVVDGICQGSTFKQIARQLGLSPSTVSNHLYRIYLKLGINTRSELVSLTQMSIDKN